MGNGKKFKLGLSLGSGGAKGMAHIGVLKALEEADLDFDVVGGSSIGSIVGGLYAKGYSSDDMLALLRETDLTDPQIMMAFAFGGLDLSDIVSRFTGGAHFSDLKKPFAAVAVDALKGEEVVFTEGNLAIALAASSAIPPFRPINYGGRVLVDGAFLNYVPSDVVKDLGADFVLAVNLGKGRDTNQEIKEKLDKIYPENKIPYANRSKQCYLFSDYVLHPDLSGFSTFSIDGLEDIYEIGYNTAKQEIARIIEQINTRKDEKK